MWEIGLLRKPVNNQLAMPLPVDQDMVNLPELTELERMDGMYQTMGLYTEGHVMSYIRSTLGLQVVTSQEVMNLNDGSVVDVAGLVIRRQRPLGKAVFITLEDEHGHIPLVIWPKVYEKYRQVLKEPLVMAQGTVSRREGTMNIIVSEARVITTLEMVPEAKNWM